MRSPRYFAVAVRAPNKEIVLQSEPLTKSWIGRQKWLKFPFLRGSLALLDALALGSKAMKFAADVQMDERYAEGKATEGSEGASAEGSTIVSHSKQGGNTINSLAVGGAMIFGILVGLFLFVLAPNLLGELFKNAGVTDARTLNLISGLLKVVVFIGYIWAIGRMAEIRRVFKYHGAEHKAINALEADQPLTSENCRAQTRLHPRCGTSFAIIVLIIDIFALTFVPRYVLGTDAPTFLNLLARFGINVAILPIIAGIAYELIRFAGKFRHSGVVNAMFAPGLATQYLTTVEPDDDQIEVALVALRAVVDAEAAHEVAKA